MTIKSLLEEVAKTLGLTFGELRVTFTDGKVVHVESEKSHDLNVLLKEIAH